MNIWHLILGAGALYTAWWFWRIGRAFLRKRRAILNQFKKQREEHERKELERSKEWMKNVKYAQRIEYGKKDKKDDSHS